MQSEISSALPVVYLSFLLNFQLDIFSPCKYYIIVSETGTIQGDFPIPVQTHNQADVYCLQGRKLPFFGRWRRSDECPPALKFLLLSHEI